MDTKKLYVGGLPYTINDSQLEELFRPFGTVVSAKVITDKYSGSSRGFGFVEMNSTEEADNAMRELNNKEIGGRSIFVKVALEKTDNNQRFQNRRRY